VTTTTLTRSTGGSTSAEPTRQTTDQWVNLAHMILQNAGVHMGGSKVSRLVRQFEHTVARNGWSFLDYIGNAIQLTAQQRVDAMNNPDIARVISYADPTGETAVNNITRKAHQ
jgi:hypothetical protein